MATTACFIIVSRNDIPIYEAEVGSATKVWTSFLLFIFSIYLFIACLIGNSNSAKWNVCDWFY
jgi:hypothetical protein